METKICVFEENQITFTLSKDNKMMINATEMAKVFDKKVENFTRIDSTQEFINSCLELSNLEANKTPKSVLFNINSVDDLIISRQKSGTFMHRILALKFAAWLSPKFEVWVYSTIENLLFGKHVEREKSFERTISLQKEMDTLKDKPNKTGEDFERYLEISREINREKQIRSSLTKESINGLQLSFPEDEEE